MSPESVTTALTSSGVRFGVRVMPRSPRTRIGGVRDGRLIVRVTAAPVDRAANEAARSALASALRMPVGSVTIALGETGRNKTIEVRGVGIPEIQAWLASCAE